MATYNTKAIGEPATQPSYVQAVATGPTQPTLSQSEWKNSRVISEDLQRGTISLQYLVDGTPDEVWAGSGTGGFQLGHTAPPWFPYSFLVARQFEHHVYGDGSTSTAKTMATYTYQKRPCFGLYEEDFNISLVGYQTVWSYDNPPQLISGNIAESFNILFPQIVYRRRWPNVRMTAFEMVNLQLLAGKTSSTGFLSQPPGFWLIEGIQAKLLYGKSQQGSIEPANWDLSIVFRGDPWRRHEWWIPDFNRRPETNSFDDMRAAHFVRTFYQRIAVDFDSLVSTGASIPGDCLPDAP